MTLSDKIHWITGDEDKKLLMIQSDDVKQFIKELKEYINDCNHASPEQQCDEINKLAGDKLI